MGFSVLGSLGSHVFVRTSHPRPLTIQSVRERERRNISFKLSRFKVMSRKSELVDFDERTSPIEVRKEIERCYELIHRLGRGVVYLGSSRMGPDHSHYLQVLELGREIANLLECTSWTGAGPGLMDAATKGALQAGKPVGGFKIGKEAGEWTASNYHPYLPSEVYLTCRFFSARKHGLVDAAVRSSSADKTAVVALPGGIGTLDEMFEILALIQLQRIGSELPVPFLLMNYDSFYSKLLDFLDDCEVWGTLSKGEVSCLWKVCDSNSEALSYLAEFYNLHASDKDNHAKELLSAS
ncbi:PREDICTED: probable cytokinin riboside 5'-monophosphate phosphoribohydrolase LOGL10 [Fragaria vesca subsp. vesca]|uniref:probable cytokinin riboside 5'-monophosphate phosphoribohydrolase LOGL10 n=1 Tax=Fragaria vesca subsp. vesca TaxID=101020 RepID=UPI0002C30E86|nr:PREDICTED: probable cytokinin riboside 5'-monophosphate phosphoribohydrolase LOGL10 [Fragaria vesca subsp. vesca]